MRKTIDFIGDLKGEWCFNWHALTHSIWNWQKALIFSVFHPFSIGQQ